MEITTEYSFEDCFDLSDSEDIYNRWRRTIDNVWKNITLINHFGWLPGLVKYLASAFCYFLVTDMSIIFGYNAAGLPTPPFTRLSSNPQRLPFSEPRVFRPEGWLVVVTGRLDKYLVAFGRGSRNCVGMNLGVAELYLSLAAVAGHLRWSIIWWRR